MSSSGEGATVPVRGTGNCHGTRVEGEGAGEGDRDLGGGVAWRRSLFLGVKDGDAKDGSARE